MRIQEQMQGQQLGRSLFSPRENIVDLVHGIRLVVMQVVRNGLIQAIF